MMVPMEVRDATEADEPALLDLVNLGQPESVSLDAYRRMRATREPQDLRARRLGLEGSQVVGYLNVERHPLEPEDWAAVTVKVAPGFRGHGRGRTLWDEALDLTRGSKMLTGGVRDDDPASRQWVERRGFALWAHRFQSVLDLTAFNPGRLAGAIERVESAGVHLRTFADLASQPESSNRLHALVSQVGRLTPDNDQGTAPSRGEFDRFFLDPSIHPPAGAVIAVDGTEWIGITMLMNREPGFMYTSISGVLESHQGRGIALALKLRSTEIARSMGATRMGTNNLSINAPILAVNRKMGYEPQPGIWLMRKPL